MDPDICNPMQHIALAGYADVTISASSNMSRAADTLASFETDSDV
jgi:hypothetical protein